MPFPVVYGLPDTTPKEVLQKLRADIITAVADELGIDSRIVRPFFIRI
jgi:hypothetical protein